MKCKRCKRVVNSDLKYCEECRQRQKIIHARCREKKKQNGVCCNCSQKAKDGRTLCEVCLEKGRNRVEEMKKNGICIDCGAASYGNCYCDECRIKRKKTHRENRKYKKQHNICVDCELPAKIGHIKCENCFARNNARKHNLLDAGLCVICGKEPPITGRQRCPTCNQYDIERRLEFKKRGDCHYCGRRRNAHHSCCNACYLKRTAKANLGASRFWKNLQDLFTQQEQTCPYTGLNLTIGLDTEIDHIIPKSRGGKNEISNLQWVHKTVNKMKNNIPREEFIRICMLVAQNTHGSI